MMKSFWCCLGLLAAITQSWGAGAGATVVVVYNKNLPESKSLAEYYASQRSIPKDQLFGVDVSATADAMSRAEFQDKLQKPLHAWLVKQGLFTRNERKDSATSFHPLIASRVRYIVLSYGIPWKIARDVALVEDNADKVPEPLRGRNEAAVDADLSLLPASQNKRLPLTGPIVSPFYLATNAAAFHPTNGLIMVARLDGPSVEIARGLVDKALQAETNGLWGHAYFDTRGITNGEYKTGDDWLRGGAEVARRAGFETTVDDQESIFPGAFPMSQIGLYAGWYEQSASGPFTRSTAEFMPGAFAYHLHSYSAAHLRSTNLNWVGPLLAKGATISMGSVDEPYLTGTPNVAAFLDRLIVRGWSYGEAAYASQGAISWQTTVVGDPLYRPFAEAPALLHFKLEREKNPLVEWSHLRVVNLNLAQGATAKDALQYLNSLRGVVTKSAVLQEKLGQLLQREKRISAACEEFDAALKSNPSPQQKIRLLLNLAELQTLVARDQAAFAAYKKLITEAPDYPDAARIYRELASLARKLKKPDEAGKFDQQAQAAGRAEK